MHKDYTIKSLKETIENKYIKIVEIKQFLMDEK